VTEFIVVAVIVAVVLVIGVRLGMLVARRLTSWTERDDEEPRDDGPG
jgi:hypothetical protein